MQTSPSELVTMSAKEIDRLTVIQRVQERCLSQKKAADMLGVSTRQMRRLAKSYGQDGARGLVSKRRGRRANNAMESEFRQRVMALVAERYSDFGPTLATEKLAELHGLRVSRETLRKWMIASRFWMTRRDRAAQVHQPRLRRECFGELVQIDGCDHDGFEGRGERCSLLVYVDDATGTLNGAAICQDRVGVRLLRRDEELPAEAWAAGGVLQRQAQHLPGGARGFPWPRQGNHPVRARSR
jgi:hypothetical protein